MVLSLQTSDHLSALFIKRRKGLDAVGHRRAIWPTRDRPLAVSAEGDRPRHIAGFLAASQFHELALFRRPPEVVEDGEGQSADQHRR